MSVARLASLADVEDALGRSLTSDETAIASFALDKASEMFRRESGQTFTPASSTVRLKVNDGVVELTQRPATDVSSVADDDAGDVDFEWSGQRVTVDMDSREYLTVTYDHGGDVPDLVRLAVAEIAARNVRLDDDARRGVSQFSNVAGPFNASGTFASWAVGGQVLLSPEDKALARSYRASVPTVRVMGVRAERSTQWRF